MGKTERTDKAVNESYGIELELITNKFKQKIEQVKSAFKGIKNEKIDMAQQIKIDKLNRQYQLAANEAEALRQKVKRLKNEMSSMQEWQIGTKPYIKLQNELEKVSLKYEKAAIKADNLSDQINAAEKSTNNMSNKFDVSKITKGIDKATSQIKRFGLSLLSIRSIWALVSRASSAYLSQDMELANKLQAVWTGLGAMLAPVIENIVNIMLKAVKYINIFVKALTGVDLLAKATTKSINNTTKSAKALSKTLAGFDEITNLDTTSDTSGWGTAGVLSAFDNVKVDTTWADKIRDFGLWVKDNFPEIIALIGGVATAIEAIKLGVTGIQALGIGLAITGVIKLIQDVKKLLEDPVWDNFMDTLIDLTLVVGGVGLAFGAWPVAVGAAIAAIVLLITKNWEEIKKKVEEIKKNIVGKIEEIKSNATNKIEEIKTKVVNFLNEMSTRLDKIVPGIGNILNTITMKVSSVFDTIKFIVNYGLSFISGLIQSNIEIWVQRFEGVKKAFENIFEGIKQIAAGDFSNGLKSIFKGIANYAIGILNGLIGKINSVLTPIRTLIVEAGNLFGANLNMSTMKIPYVPYLDVGTNYVPEDQLAYIHKGEAVIPKKFNSSEYFNGGNDETNELLQQVIEAINNIDINPYTTIKDVGKTAVNYINSRNRQYGRSVIA